MIIKNRSIDGGREFEWGRVSEDYARFRDIYPTEFYERLINRGLCVKGQRCLDLGTGTGVLPRNLCKYGADFVGTDIDEGQILQARRLSKEMGMNIEYRTASAETVDFPEKSFDVITACQCHIYFNHYVAAPRLAKMLKDSGKLVYLWMAWLPYEDKIAAESERIILKYNPKWNGSGAQITPIEIPSAALEYFDAEYSEEWRLPVHFTRESWHGRIKACRGTGASMSADVFAAWEAEHRAFMETAPEEFDITHYAAVLVMKKKG